MPTGEPIQDSTLRFQVSIQAARPGSNLITLTSSTSYGEDVALAQAVVQDLVDLIAASETFSVIEALELTAAAAPITPTPAPPGGE